jgi:hypothetical protein
MPFSCSICEQESTRICVECTKDACGNHLCERCQCCSDCCECEVVLARDYAYEIPTVHAATPPIPKPEPEPPVPDPEPEPHEPEPNPVAE